MLKDAITRRKLSGSTDGTPILIAATSSPGTLVHTASSTTDDGSWDEVWLWLSNTSASDVLVTVQFGGVAAKDEIKYTVTARDGLKCMLPGSRLQNGLEVRVYAATTNVINAVGHVDRYERT